MNMNKKNKVMVYGLRFDMEYAYNRPDMGWFANQTGVSFIQVSRKFYRRKQTCTLIYLARETRDSAIEVARMRFKGYQSEDLLLSKKIYEKMTGNLPA
jgi:hypothetical protein